MTTAQYAAQRCAHGGTTSAVSAGRRWMEVKIVRLVDLDAVIDHLEVEWGYEGIREDLYSLPVVDAVPVVRCKDCKMWGKRNIFEHSDTGRMRRGGYCMCSRFTRYEDDFCSSGEYQTNTGGVTHD